MKLLIIINLLILILLLVLALIIANAIINEKNEIIDAKEKIIASMVEKDDYQS